MDEVEDSLEEPEKFFADPPPPLEGEEQLGYKEAMDTLTIPLSAISVSTEKAKIDTPANPVQPTYAYKFIRGGNKSGGFESQLTRTQKARGLQCLPYVSTSGFLTYCQVHKYPLGLVTEAVVFDAASLLSLGEYLTENPKLDFRLLTDSSWLGSFIDWNKSTGVEVANILLRKDIHLTSYWDRLSSDLSSKQQYSKTYRVPVFARPCPTKPQHGWLESRVVHHLGEVIELAREAITLDPEAELLLMPFKKSARWSAVVNSTMASMAEGNDGCTSGKPSLTLACPHGDLFKLLDFLGTSVGIAEGDDGYFEIVEGSYVQLRGGPKTTSSNQFIPEAFMCLHVMSPKDNGGNDFMDLLQWEKYLRSCLYNSICKWPVTDKSESKFSPAQAGLAVWIPGGSMLSHYAIHARLLNIPVIVEDKSPVGRPFQDDGNSSGPSGKEIHAELKEMMPTMADFTTQLLREDTQHVIIPCVVQGGIQWCEGFAMRLRVAALNALIRVGVAACVGELRHMRTKIPTFSPTVKQWGPLPKTRAVEEGSWMQDIGLPIPSLHNCSRSYIYRAILCICDASSPQLVPLLEAVETDFSTEPWSPGFGGIMWANCARATRDAALAYKRLVNDPRRYRLDALHLEVNKLLSVMHNGSQMVTKLIGLSCLEIAATCPSLGLANEGMWRLYKGLTGEELEKGVTVRSYSPDE